MYGLIAYALAAAVALGAAFGAGWHYGAKGPRADLARLEAKVAREDAARVLELAQRRADDERAIARLREDAAQSEAALRTAAARADAAEARASALATRLRATPAGGCLLPPDARRVFDSAAGSGGSATDRPTAAEDHPPATPGAVAGATDAYDLAPRPADSAPVDCVTTWEVGVRNTAKALYNADALDACNVSLISYWQACTGKTFNP